jgi:hypothetical protein
MFNVGNKVIIKSNNKEGFIHSIIDDNNYVVGIFDDNTVTMDILKPSDIRMKTCKNKHGGICDSEIGVLRCDCCIYPLPNEDDINYTKI